MSEVRWGGVRAPDGCIVYLYTVQQGDRAHDPGERLLKVCVNSSLASVTVTEAPAGLAAPPPDQDCYCLVYAVDDPQSFGENQTEQ